TAASPASAVSSAVSTIGSTADTAMRVAGSVPPKMIMPTKPSSKPSRSRDNGGDDSRDSEGEDIARQLSASPVQVQRWRAPHGGHAPVSEECSRPDRYRKETTGPARGRTRAW